MNQAKALTLIRSKASQRYNSAKAEALLKFLARKVSIHVKGQRDTTLDIEKRWQELKLFTVLDGVTVDESYFYRLMAKVEDVVEYEVKHRKIKYRLNLEPLRAFQAKPKLNSEERLAERHAAKLKKMRDEYRVNREQKKAEEVRTTQGEFLKSILDPASRSHAFVKSMFAFLDRQASNLKKGANAAQ